MNPKISVVMSNYNGEKYLQESIDSILNQTFKDFEFIIVDDASTDGSLKMIEKYNDSRIVVLKNEVNLGLTKSLNKALRAAKGEFIARMDADDISEPNRFEKQIEFFNVNSEYSLVGTWASYLNAEGIKIDKVTPVSTNEEIVASIIFFNQFVHSSVMFRLRDIAELGNYNEKIKKSQDYDLWLRLILNEKKVANIPEYLVRYREHSGSISKTNSSEQESFSSLAVSINLKEYLDLDIPTSIVSSIRRIILHNQKIPLTSFLGIIPTLSLLKKKFMRKFSKDSIIKEKFNENILKILEIELGENRFLKRLCLLFLS